MKANVGVNEYIPDPPNSRVRVLFIALVFFFFFCILSLVFSSLQNFCKLFDHTGVVAFTPFFPFSVWCSSDFYFLANKDARLETSYC